jgi:hypothetical protein
MNILVYQIAILAVILVAASFGRRAWVIAILACATWTIFETYGALRVIQLAVVGGAAWFAHLAFSQKWSKSGSRSLSRRRDRAEARKEVTFK